MCVCGVDLSGKKWTIKYLWVIQRTSIYSFDLLIVLSDTTGTHAVHGVYLQHYCDLHSRKNGGEWERYVSLYMHIGVGGGGGGGALVSVCVVCVEIML